MTAKRLDRQTGLLLWLFTGWIGGHRFYAGRIGSGLWMGGLFLGGFVLPQILFWSFVVAGTLSLAAGGIAGIGPAIAAALGAGFMYLLGFVITFFALLGWFIWWIIDLTRLDELLGLAPPLYKQDRHQAEYVEPYQRPDRQDEDGEPPVLDAPYKRLPEK
ncbi:MAG: hypothetical protein Alpg2KO_06900 [Alphaproteobacteria bacterium]